MNHSRGDLIHTFVLGVLIGITAGLVLALWTHNIAVMENGSCPSAPERANPPHDCGCGHGPF